MPKRKATKGASPPRYALLRHTPENNRLLMTTPSWPTMAVHEAERMKLIIAKSISFQEVPHGHAVPIH